MRRILGSILVLGLAAAAFQAGTLVKERQILKEQVIRLHVVADSDSREDQTLKLQVKDAVSGYLAHVLENIGDVKQAKEYLRQAIPEVKALAESVLVQVGCYKEVTVALVEAAFDTGYYDTFALPAGVYEALRITIGDGEGENRWRVVFPGLCAGEAEFADTAVEAGFSDSLSATLQGEEGYELRFLLLEWLGELEKFLRLG